MDTEQFISRLVPPGNFFVVAYKGDKGMRHKYFRDAPATAGYIKWAAGKGMDTWHACSSFAKETQKTNQSGGTWLDVERKQDNVAEIKAFWVDLDIARPGDGKNPAKVYADPAAATTWLKTFCKAIAIPLPNVIVNSGYGLHIYWMVETAMSPATWQPYAEALKAAILAHNGLADIVVTADSARILRTPGTFNFKVPATPMPVKALLAQPDYPNAVIYAALQPFVGVVAHTTVGSTGLGPAPAHVGASALNAAAQTNVAPRVMDKSFAAIATKCEQIRHSLATNGAQDSRPIWYLGNLSTAHHTIDGADFVHPISSGHKDYDPAAIDKAVAAIVNEKRNKDSGPPTCRFYDQQRPGICQSCAFFGKVTHPWHLGAKDGDLPKGYRRHNGRIEKERHTKDAIFWDHVVDGDVYGPVLSVINDVYHLSFTYEVAGRTMPISISALESSMDIGFNIRLFNSQRMTLDTTNAVNFGAFAMAFLNLLKKQRLEREDTVKPYGWSTDEKGEITGIAIGGMHYKSDGTTEAVSGAEREQAGFYKPRGELPTWKKAASYLIRGRRDVQLMLAISMGAPLMRFTAQPGLVMNFWSTATGTGKSTAIRVAQNVWATQAAMTTMLDTDNAVCARVAEGQIVPLLWDEIRIDAENQRTKTNLMFSIAQGKDKTRMRADTSVRVGKEWQTLMVCTGNQPLLHLLSGTNAATDANGMRIMDFEINLGKLPPNNTVAMLVKNADYAAGAAGKVLAEYYASHHTAIAAKVMKMQDFITNQMECKDSGERFYIAAMACALVAADISKKLDVLPLNVSEIWAYAKMNWLQIRGEKTGDVTQNGKIDVAEVFGRFYTDHSHRHVITNFFRKQGPTKKGDVFTTVGAPNSMNQPVAMHTTQREKILRVDLAAFKAWLAKKNLPVSTMLTQMKAQWGVVDNMRQVLGGGTIFAGGQKLALDISLAHPDLAGYDQGDDPTDPANSPTKAKVKAAPVPGNQVI